MGALPLGTVYTTRDKYFDPNTTKNDLFVGVWERIDEYDIYPVATSEGSSHIEMNEADIIGSNNESVNIDWQHTHSIPASGNHSHNLKHDPRFATGSGTAPFTGGTGSSSSYFTGTDGAHSHNPSNSGTQTSSTKTINNRPRSFKTTMWIRIS